MSTDSKPSHYAAGMVLLFIPVALGLLFISGVLPRIAWVDITVVAVIVACVGVGVYLLWFRPPTSGGQEGWKPSQTLPQDD